MTWPQHFRRAVLLGLAWAVAWAPIAVLVGLTIIDPDNSMDEMWPVIGAYPGFLCAIVFCILLGVAEGGRKFRELSVSRAAAWGALSGVLVGVLPFLIGSASTTLDPWLLASIVIGAFSMMSASSAVATVLTASYVTERRDGTA